MKRRELRKLLKLIPSSMMMRLKKQCRKGITLEVRRRSATDKDMNEDIMDAFKNLKNAVKELEVLLENEQDNIQD